MNTRHLIPLLCGALAGGIALNAWGLDPVRVIRTPNEGAVPDAEMGQDGIVHLTYVSRDDVYYTFSTNGGATFSTSLRVNSQAETAHPPGMFRGPDLALGRNDSVHIIWYANSYQKKRPKEEWGVYYSHLTNRAFVPSLNLNQQPSDNFSLAADPNGNVAVFWMAAGLYVNRSSNGGATFGPAEKLALADSCECCASRALFGPDGTLFCAYRDKAENQRDMFLLARVSKADAWTRTRVSGFPWLINGCPMTGTYLARGSDGLTMAWETKGRISFARFDAAGQMRGKEIVASGSGRYPVALTDAGGTTCVSWKKGSVLHWRQFGKDGQPMGEEASQPSANSHRHAGVVTKTGGFLLID